MLAVSVSPRLGFLGSFSGRAEKSHRCWDFAAFCGRLRFHYFGFERFDPLVHAYVPWNALTARYEHAEACAPYCGGKKYLVVVRKRF